MASPNAPPDTEAEKVQTLTPCYCRMCLGRATTSDVRQQEEDNGGQMVGDYTLNTPFT